MSKSTYPLKLPSSVKNAGGAKPKDLLKYLRRAPKATQPDNDWVDAKTR